MSPRIGLDVDISGAVPESDRPLDRIRAAVRLVEAQGLAVCRHGMHATGRDSLTRGWTVQLRGLRPLTVTVVDAVCLALQPLEAGDHPEEGAANALGVSWDWLSGVLDGWDCDAQTTLLSGASRALYLDGVRTGHLLWFELTTECPDCGGRRHHKERSCRPCTGR